MMSHCRVQKEAEEAAAVPQMETQVEKLLVGLLDSKKGAEV